MRHHDTEYVELKGLIADMSSSVSTMVRDSVKSLVDRDSDLARAVIQRDDHVDSLDVEIDQHCMKIFALFEPKAVDLRFIMAANRIIVDLERVGDHCVSICKEVIRINEHPQIKPYIDLPKMGEIASDMVEEAVHCYLERQSDAALEVIQKDDAVDHLNNQILRELLTYLAEDMKKTQVIFSLMMIAKGLERIADYATNIAENVFFMVTGDVIRHKPLEEVTDETDTGN